MVARAPLGPAGRQLEIGVDEPLDRRRKWSLDFVAAEDEETRLVADDVYEVVGGDEGMSRRGGLVGKAGRN